MQLSDKKIVEMLLENYPVSRDDEQHLYILYMQTKKLDPSKVTVKILFNKILTGRLKSIDTVARYSRMIQEKRDDLKGEEWGKRKTKEKEVAKEIREQKPIDMAVSNGVIDSQNRRYDQQPSFPGM